MQKQAKKLSSFRLTDTAGGLLDGLTVATGLDKTGVVETAIREMAERRGVRVSSDEAPKPDDKNAPVE